MYMNTLTIRTVEADLQRKLRISAARRAIHTDGARRPRPLAIRSVARWMRLRPTLAVVSSIPIERTPQ